MTTTDRIRRRLRAAAAQGARQVLDRTAPPPPPTPPTPERRLGLRWVEPLRTDLGVERASASRVLLDRLAPDAVAEIDARVAADPQFAEPFAHADEEHRLRIRLALGTHFGVGDVAQRTGLPTAQPPEDVHVMARGPLSAAGGLYEADLVADALAGVGVDVARVRSALDFGCSSGRVLRVLSAAYPEVAWHGCDPNGPAIAWARRELPGAQYFRSGDAPPLDLPDASLDLAYAISIWSHFNPALGLLWLAEMHRLLRPGGILLMTTHGTTTIAHDLRAGLRDEEQAQEIALALSESGSWYHEEFGDDGDWGVVNPDWGTAFVSAEWVLTYACPAWQVLDFAPGRNAGNQDVWVLRRV